MKRKANSAVKLMEVHAEGQRRAVPEGESLSFGRGGRIRVDLELSEDPGLSALAGRVTHMPYGVHIACLQRTEAGSMTVVLPGGQAAARMTRGNEYVCGDPVFQIQLRVGRLGTLLVLHVERNRDDAAAGTRTDDEHGDQVGQGTVSSWRAPDVLQPTLDSRWQTVCALACLRVVGSAVEELPAAWELWVPTFSWLRSACASYFGVTVSARWLSNRLDEALIALSLPQDGQDKIARVVATVIGGRHLSSGTLRAVANRLDERRVPRPAPARPSR